MAELTQDLAAAVAAAVQALRRGEVIAYPTETFYGLGVDACDEAALARLAALKGLGADRAISVLVVGRPMLDLLCAPPSATACRLMDAHWPGPLTLALPARAGLPPALVADGCVAVRESPHPVARALVAGLGRPLTTTSANRTGQPPATTAAAVRASFPAGCHVVEGGATAGGAPSTLVRVRGEVVEVLRQGAIHLDGGG